MIVVGLGLEVVGNLERGVEALADAVAAVGAHHAVPFSVAWASMARPMSLMGRPGLTAAMPSIRHSRVTWTSRWLSASTLPTR